jgi:hypothetical protein
MVASPANAICSYASSIFAGGSLLSMSYTAKGMEYVSIIADATSNAPTYTNTCCPVYFAVAKTIVPLAYSNTVFRLLIGTGKIGTSSLLKNVHTLSVSYVEVEFRLNVVLTGVNLLKNKL